jgi:Leucine-rich repeat (LRR) protein
LNVTQFFSSSEIEASGQDLKEDKMDLFCEFSDFNSNEYWCIVNQATVTGRCEIKQLKGDHQPKKSDGDVHVLKFENTTVYYLPGELYKRFSNLKMLIVLGCQLKEITSEDLFGLDNLEELCIDNNNLKSLPDDLFINNKKLTIITFDGNKIETMSSGILDNFSQDQLRYVSLRNNDNNEAMYRPGSGKGLKSLQELKTVIDKTFCHPTETFATTDGPSTSPPTQFPMIKDETFCPTTSPSFQTLKIEAKAETKILSVKQPHFCYADCKFISSEKYMCVVEIVNIRKREDIVLFEGQHEKGKSNEDVEILKFVKSSAANKLYVKVLPSGLYKTFPKLKELIVDSCGLENITSDDLFGLENLEKLWIDNNDLKSLPDDLFQHTKKLKRIIFRKNKLEFMNPELLDPKLDEQLEYVGFEKNEKIDSFYWPEWRESLKSIESLREKIKSSCFRYPPNPLKKTQQAENDFKNVSINEVVPTL